MPDVKPSIHPVKPSKTISSSMVADGKSAGPVELARHAQENWATEWHGTNLTCITGLLSVCETPYDCLTGVLQICEGLVSASVAVLVCGGASNSGSTVSAGKPGFGRPDWPDVSRMMVGPQQVADLAELPSQVPMPAAAQAYRSLLSVPVTVTGVSPMALVLLAMPTAAFSDSDRAFLQSVGRLLEHSFQKVPQSDKASDPSPQHDAGQTDAHWPETSLADISRTYRHLTEWQGAILDATNALLGAQWKGMDKAIDVVLANIGALASADRICVFCLGAPERPGSFHEWAAPGMDPIGVQMDDMCAVIVAEFRSRLDAGEVVEVADTQSLAPESILRRAMLMQDVKSLLLVPMISDGKLAGFVSYHAVRRHRTFLPLEIQLLKSVAKAIIATMERAAIEAGAEEALAGLQAERDRLQATLVALPELMLELDVEMRLISYNNLAQIGDFVPLERLEGRYPEQFLPETISVPLRKMLLSLIEGGPPGQMDCELEVAGVWRYLYVTAAPISRHGSLAGYVLVVRDITSRRRQQRELLLKSKIAELTSNLVIVTDANQLIEWVNPAFERRTGWQLEDVRGKEPKDILQSPFDNLAVARRMAAAMALGEPYQGQIKNRTRRGEDYWVSSDVQPLIAENGVLEGFVAVQTDITELRRSHERVLRDRAQAMEASMDGIAISDKSGRYTYMNKAHREMFGIGPDDDIQTLSWSDLCPLDVAKAFLAQHWQELKRKGTFQGELTGMSRSGELLQTEVSVTLRENDGLLWIARDISQRVKANLEQTQLREQLQLAQRRETIAHVTAGVAHDLTNIVAVVAGTANLLVRQSGTNQDILAGLARIQRATDIARDLVTGLCSLGRREVKRDSHDLHALILQGQELLGTDRIKKYAVQLSLPNDSQNVWADPTQILQVFLNLALNACEAGPSETNHVKIKVLAPNEAHPGRHCDIGAMSPDIPYCFFVVSDTGSGVEPQQKQRLFERYFTTKGNAGTGLGLPIVASIVEENDAALWFDSTLGEGSTVTVAWPSGNRSNNQVTQPESLASSNIDLSGRNILVVDDLADVADTLAEMIETSGAVAIAVSDSTEAQLLLSENPGVWHALVTDFHMPGLNGADLALLARSMVPPLATVLVTALPKKAFENPELFDAILSKPVDAVRLIDSIKNAIGRRLDAERETGS